MSLFKKFRLTILIKTDSGRFPIRGGQRWQNHVHLRDGIGSRGSIPSGAHRQQHLRVRSPSGPRRDQPIAQHATTITSRSPLSFALHHLIIIIHISRLPSKLGLSILPLVTPTRLRDRKVVFHPHEMRPSQTQCRSNKRRLQGHSLCWLPQDSPF